MHKRSLLGILEGLKNLGIIAEVEGVYQPRLDQLGVVDQKRRRRQENCERGLVLGPCPEEEDSH
jgi:hypothetical protein